MECRSLLTLCFVIRPQCLCNLEAWSLRRFFEIDLLLRSPGLAAQFEERFSVPAEEVSRPGRALTGTKERLKARGFALISPLL